MSVREDHNILCPRCKDDNGFTVAFTGQARITSGGTDDCGDHEWDDESALTCDCGWEGTVGEAREFHTRFGEPVTIIQTFFRDAAELSRRLKRNQKGAIEDAYDELMALVDQARADWEDAL
jgi:hypothetical protein